MQQRGIGKCAGSATLPERELAQLKGLAERLGERAAREVVGVSRESFARLLAGLPVRRGTVALVRVGLARAGAGEQRP